MFGTASTSNVSLSSLAAAECGLIAAVLPAHFSTSSLAVSGSPWDSALVEAGIAHSMARMVVSAKRIIRAGDT